MAIGLVMKFLLVPGFSHGWQKTYPSGDTLFEVGALLRLQIDLARCCAEQSRVRCLSVSDTASTV